MRSIGWWIALIVHTYTHTHILTHTYSHTHAHTYTHTHNAHTHTLHLSQLRDDDDVTPVILLPNMAHHLYGPSRPLGAVMCGYSGVRTFEPQVSSVNRAHFRPARKSFFWFNPGAHIVKEHPTMITVLV